MECWCLPRAFRKWYLNSINARDATSKRKRCKFFAVVAIVLLLLVRNLGSMLIHRTVSAPVTRWPMDAIATVCSGAVYTERLLPVWLHALREEAKWSGPIYIACDECEHMASMQVVRDDKQVHLISMEEEAKEAAHDVRSVGMGLNIEKRFWKFTMILKFMDRDPNVQRILVADVDAIATNALNYWMLSMEGLMDQSYGHGRGHGHGSCFKDLMVSGERIGVDSPINAGIFLAHRTCSRECVKGIVDMHEHAKANSFKMNNQEAIVHLMKNDTCKVARFSSAIQDFKATNSAIVKAVGQPTSMVWPPAFEHFTRVERRFKCEEGGQTPEMIAGSNIGWGEWTYSTVLGKRVRSPADCESGQAYQDKFARESRRLRSGAAGR
mmetsp:Transcript_23430/g.62933  ORF Transcript_23430/g.62933 Transcript_23430/m.62933 type:complete len:381 (+) Transcript_23430:270-1412(+)